MPVKEYALALTAGWRTCLACWKPRPLAEPVCSPHLENLSFPVRSCLCVQYGFLRLEYAISRGGHLREWVKLNLLIALTLGVPAFLILPQACILASLFSVFAISMEQALLATLHAVLYGLGCIGLLTASGMILRAVLKHRK